MKKIMFNDRYGLTEAVLSSRKTQTRRLIKLSDVEDYTADIAYAGKTWEAIEKSIIARHAKYKVGEVVAVAQSYKDVAERLAKKAYDVAKWMDDYNITKDMAGWLNKMFVKASLMIFKIRITNVRVERLQEISDEDCIKEGVYVGTSGITYHVMDLGICANTPQEAYATLIDRISGRGTFENNPWVLVYDFELVK